MFAFWFVSSFMLVSSQTLQPESLIQDANIIEFSASDYDHNTGAWPSTDNLYRFSGLPTSENLDDESVHFDGSVVATVDYDISPSNAEQLTIEMEVFVHSSSPALNNRGWFVGHDNGGYDRSVHFHDTRYGGDVNNPLISLGIGSAYSSTVPCPLDTWFTLHAVWDNDQAYVYIDGELQQTITGVAAGEGHADFSVGGLVQYEGHQAIADLHSLRIYNVALSQDDISTGTLTLFGGESATSDDAKSTVSCPDGYTAQSCACLGTMCEGEYFSSGGSIAADWSGPTSDDVCVAHRSYGGDGTGVVAAVTCQPGEDNLVNVESAPNGNSCDSRDGLQNMCAGDRTATCPDNYVAVDCNCVSYWIQCPAQTTWRMDETSCSFNAPGKAVAQVRCVEMVPAFTVEFQVSSWSDQSSDLGNDNRDITQLAELSFYDESGSLISPISVSSLGCSEPPAGEEADKAADGNGDTKWLTFQPCSLVYEFAGGVSLDSYNIMTGNDYPARDPKSWVILKDGEVWARVSSDDVQSPYDRDAWMSETNFPLGSSEMVDFFGSSYDPASCHPDTMGIFDPDGTWKGRRDYQRQCKRGNVGPTAFSEHWSLIQTHSQFFGASDCASDGCICDILSISGKAPDCERTAAFLMTLTLNLIEGNIPACVCVEHSVAGTTAEVYGYVDDLLASGDLTWQQCRDASNALIDIDEGESIIECSA